MSALFVVAICGTLGCTRNTPPKCFEDRSEDKELSTAELKAIETSARRAKKECSDPNTQCGYSARTHQDGTISVHVQFVGISKSGQCVYITGGDNFDEYDKNGVYLNSVPGV